MMDRKELTLVTITETNKFEMTGEMWESIMKIKHPKVDNSKIEIWTMDKKGLRRLDQNGNVLFDYSIK